MSIVRVVQGGGIPRAITPSDTKILSGLKAIWSDGGGVVSLQYRNETPLTMNIPAQTWVPLADGIKVRATGTVATGIIGAFEEPS